MFSTILWTCGPSSASETVLMLQLKSNRPAQLHHSVETKTDVGQAFSPVVVWVSGEPVCFSNVFRHFHQETAPPYTLLSATPSPSQCGTGFSLCVFQMFFR